MALSAVLLACGGRAADGLEPEVSAPGTSSTDDEPTVVRPVRETCEDNPLLAGCPFASTGAATPPPSPPATPEPIPDDEPQYITRARFILTAYCGGCHGASLTEAQALGGINYISDWEQLIEAGLIDLCSPESSRVVVVMRTGEMPPAASGLDAVSDADIHVVEEGIELDCKYR
jgi:mono/diheme cytochrome c family protein